MCCAIPVSLFPCREVPPRLIRVDAAGRIETIDTMKAGLSTGLTLPVQLGQISELAAALTSHMDVLPLAA